VLRRFEVHRATTVDEAIALRQRYGGDAAVYAGGTELLMTMKLGVARWPHLIDVKPIRSLRGVAPINGHIAIGATTTHWELERDATIRRALPAFARLEANVANVRVRAAGTLAGNLVFAEPHADPPALLMALGAELVLQGPKGTRSLSIDRFVTGMYETALAPDEIVTAITVPIPPTTLRAAYVKFQILERPSVGVAIAAAMTGTAFDGAPAVVVGAVDEMPRRVPTSDLAGADARDGATADRIAEAAMRAVDPVADLAGAADYKRHLVGVFARRALASLVAAA
jgi:carbon-monoxide dehydrogenase medium subunit